jgi:hypothetical protein
MIVDPVSVEVGDIYSTKENCSPTINIPAQIPLSIVNTATDQTALINQAVDWTIEADPALETSVNDFGADGNYVLDILPSEAGTFDIHIVGTVADPTDGTPIQFFENTTRIVITDSTQYLMDGVSLEPQMKDFALGFDDFLNRISGHSEDRDVVIGRRFFFFPQEIRLEATFVDLDTNRIGDPTLLPDIQLKNQETGEVFDNSEWVTDASGNVITNFSVSDFGNYQLIIDEKDTACDVVITLSDYVGTWRISPGLSERVLFILGVLLAIALLIFLARLAFCRWYNPLYGLVGIVDQEGKWHFWSPIDGRSCFTFKPTPPNKFGMVTKIKINGIFMPKGEFRISVYVITDPIKNKITKKRTNARLKNWRPIMLGNGFHIDWKRTIQEIKR